MIKKRKIKRVVRRAVKHTSSFVKDLILFISGLVLVVCLGIFYVRTFGVEMLVNDNAMAPAYAQGDRVSINKWCYFFSQPEAGDAAVVSLSGQETASNLYVRRIIGVPADRIRIFQGTIYVNDLPLDDENYQLKVDYSGLAEGEVTLGASEYFVLCDNYNEYREDSRLESVGLLDRTQILGRAGKSR